jgi:spermidine synthase
MDMMRVVEEIETPYNDIDVWETDTGYDFEVSGGTHATYDRHRLLTGYAWDAITAASMLRPGVDAINLLMLGLGGGTSLRQLRHLLPHCHLTAVDIDPAMVDLAKRYMALDSGCVWGGKLSAIRLEDRSVIQVPGQNSPE